MATKQKIKRSGKKKAPKYIKSKAKLANIIKVKNTERIVNTVVGCIGSGKTYETKKVIKRYIKRYPKERVLIIDPNDEYNEYPKIKVKDIANFKKPSRICLYALNADERRNILQNIAWYYKNGLLVIEDFNSITYYRTATIEFTGAITCCRTRDIDVIITFNSILSIESTIMQNTHAYRFHKIIEDRIPETYIMSNKYGDIPINYIKAECEINTKKPKYPFVYFDTVNQKIVSVTKNLFTLWSACVKHLSPTIDKLCKDVVYGKN